MEFLNLLTDRKRIMARLMVDKNDINSLDRLMNAEDGPVVKLYEEWKQRRNEPGYSIIPNSPNVLEPKPVSPIPSARTIKNDSGITSLTSTMKNTTLSPSSSSTFSPTGLGSSGLSEKITHMPEVPPELFEKLPEELTVVFLGETGVGKSTFINGMVNYLKYATIHEALQKGVEILISAHFTQTDADYNRMEITCQPTIKMERGANEENEDYGAGKSSTQSPKSYKFCWTYGDKEKAIRIIDTPGVGDVRGVSKEKENFQMILSFLADFKQINAICILLKPNEARLTLSLRYCINELLTHLHISAAANILFCFTNTRQTLYRPGETLPTLEAHLKKLKEDRQIEIPLNNNTMFCFDNESFRFLCAMTKGARFSDKEVDNFNGSWVKTVEETFRLFGRIADLKPHDVNETLSINNIRAVILAMARPLAEVARNQLLNSQLIADKVKEVEDRIAKKQDLNGRLYVDQVKIVPKEIDYPKTVCTSASCVEHMRFTSHPSAPMETVYKTICHKRCYLEGVQVEQLPNTALQRCWALYEDIETCRVCGCPWTSHIHIKYELDKVMEKIVDPTIESSIKNHDDVIRTAHLFIERENNRKNELIKESEKITTYCGEFAAFLKKNSILPYNDVYKDYVDHLIREEKNRGIQNNAMLTQLEQYKAEYESQIKILEGAKNTKGNKTTKEIYDMVDQLKKLKNSGKLLREIQELEMLSVRKQQITRSTNVRLNGGWLDKFIPTKVTPSRAQRSMFQYGFSKFS